MAESVNGQARRQHADAVHRPAARHGRGRQPGVTWPVTVTNTGAQRPAGAAAGRTFGPDTQRPVRLGHAEGRHQPAVRPTSRACRTTTRSSTSTSAPGQQRLDASIAYPADPANGNNARVRLILVDPRGRFAAHSLPQGVGNFGNVDVRNPAAGRWTGVIFGITAANSGTNGKVPWRVATERFLPFGSVSATLVPAGPRAEPDGVGARHAAGVARRLGRLDRGVLEPRWRARPPRSRSRCAAGQPARAARFRGMLTGGNGRPNGEGQQDYYQFRVGAGTKELTAKRHLANDAGDPVGRLPGQPGRRRPRLRPEHRGHGRRPRRARSPSRRTRR